MIDRLKVIWAVSLHEFRHHLSSQRMMLLAPLIIFFLSAACWGFADPRIVPVGLAASTPADVLFLSSVAVVFFCTLSVVLLGFDAVTRRRLDGELAIDLSQPMPREDYAVSQLLGVWLTAMLPTIIGTFLGVLLIHRQMGVWPSFADVGNFAIATGLLLWWYTCLQLIASSYARDLGASVTLGIGTWLFFTFLWLIPTLVAASLLGVDVTDNSSAAFDSIQEKADLFSPNGVYQLLVETRLAEDNQPRIGAGWIWFAALIWAGLPNFLFIWRMHRIKP